MGRSEATTAGAGEGDAGTTLSISLVGPVCLSHAHTCTQVMRSYGDNATRLCNICRQVLPRPSYLWLCSCTSVPFTVSFTIASHTSATHSTMVAGQFITFQEMGDIPTCLDLILRDPEIQVLLSTGLLAPSCPPDF